MKKDLQRLRKLWTAATACLYTTKDHFQERSRTIKIMTKNDKRSFSCRINRKCFPNSRKSYITVVQTATTTTTTIVNTIRYVCNVTFTFNIMIAGNNSYGKIGVLRYNTIGLNQLRLQT